MSREQELHKFAPKGLCTVNVDLENLFTLALFALGKPCKVSLHMAHNATPGRRFS